MLLNLKRLKRHTSANATAITTHNGKIAWLHFKRNSENTLLLTPKHSEGTNLLKQLAQMHSADNTMHADHMLGTLKTR